MGIECDVCVIGAGPGGYVAAIRAAQLGNSVVLVEKDKLGGTCLNYGCIPSKSLLTSTEILTLIKDTSEHGVEVGKVSVDFKKMMDRKKKVVTTLVRGVEYLVKENRIKCIQGTAICVGKPSDILNLVEVETLEGEKTVEAKNLVIAVGSEPASLKEIPYDGKNVLDSREALELEEIPKYFGVIGGGAVGLEIGTIYQRLGSEVTVIEIMDEILPETDREISTTASSLLRKQGMKFEVKSRVVRSKILPEGKVEVVYTGRDGGEERKFVFDKVLVSVGRKPNTSGLGLEKIGVELDSRGFLKVNDRMETNKKGVFAIGDVVGGKLLAHKASREGIVAVEVISGKKSFMNYKAVPASIFIKPEIAWVGLREDEAREMGYKINIGKFPLRALGRALTLGETDGFVKFITEEKTDYVIGVHVIGSHASDIISEAALAMEMDGTAEDIGNTIHIHPTLTEAMMEAALSCRKEAIHVINK